MSDATVARGLMRRAVWAALATVSAVDSGRPSASLVTVACDTDGSPLLLLSNLAEHTRNLAEDDRAALLFEVASRRANPQTGPRVSVEGRIQKTADPRHGRRFLARHPGARQYVGFADFSFYRMSVEGAQFVGGFARARRLDPGSLLAEAAAAGAVAACEEEVLAHMNEDHADAVDLYATSLLGRRGSGWRMMAVDPDGCDLRLGARIARLDFPRSATDSAALQAVLMELLKQARKAPN